MIKQSRTDLLLGEDGFMYIVKLDEQGVICEAHPICEANEHNINELIGALNAAKATVRTPVGVTKH